MLCAGEIFRDSGNEYTIIRFLGRGKSGYSYLVENEGIKYVLKTIHDEPCPYYTFEDKFKCELKAYKKLSDLNIPVPKLIKYSEAERFLIKEYIDGPTGSELIASGRIDENIISQLFSMSRALLGENINLDYFPSNFVYQDLKLFYIDYEINPYLSEWNLVNWGIFYWANPDGMKNFLETGNAGAINCQPEKGIPHRNICPEKIERWIRLFG